ncbi:FHA domain-containing protein [Pseudochelatococcus sp. B33]
MSDASLSDADPDLTLSAPAESAILKILSGVQSGVEVALSAGRYTLGSGDDDDIRIIDVSLAARHLELRITPGANQIRAAAGQVHSGNGLVLEPGSDWQEVEPLDVVMAGTTRFAIAPASAAWTSVADIPAAPPEPPAGGLAAVIGRLARAGWSGQRLARLAPPVAALALVAGAALWYLAPGGAPTGGEGPSGPADFAEVRAALEELPFARDIALRQEVDGAIYATGHVETQAERRAVAGAIGATGVPVNLRVWVLQSMHEEIAGLIEAQARNVTVEISGTGAVTLRGLIPDDAQAGRFTALVKEVPGVSEVHSSLRTPSSLLAEVEQLAQASQLKPWVLFRLDNGLIEATGALPAEEVDSWADFLQIYARRFAREIGLRSFVQLQGINVQASDASPTIGAITIGARDVNAGDVEIDVSRLQGGEVTPSELLVGGQADTPVRGTALAAAPAGASESMQAGTPADGPAGSSAGGPVGGPPWAPANGPAGVLTSVPASGKSAAGSWFPLTLLPAPAGDASAQPASSGSPSSAEAGPDAPSRAVDRPPVLRSAAAVPGAIALSRAPEGPVDAPAGAGVLAGGREAGLLPVGGGLPAFLRGGPGALPFGGIDDERAAASPATAASAVITLSPVPASAASAAGAGALAGAGEAGLLPAGAGSAAPPAVNAAAADAGVPSGLIALQTQADSAAGAAGPAPAEITWTAPDGGADPGAGQPSGGVPVLDTDPSGLAARAAPATLALTGIAAPSGVAGLSAPPPANTRIGASGATDTAGPAAPASAGNEASLADGTRLLLEQWRDGRLQQGANASLLMGALERLSREGGISASGEPSRLARQQMHDRYLPASGTYGDPAQTCWPASLLRPQDVVTALFWLDILSVGDALSLTRFDAANQAMLMEVALSPRRVARCIAGAYPGADIAEQSVYLRETRRNPAFIRFVLRDVPPFSLDVAGASTAGGRRFVQTRAGVKIGEGSYPNSASRLLVVGELGAMLETADGPAGLIYGPELNWLLD